MTDAVIIEKTKRITKLTDSADRDNLAYWLEKTPEERLEAVEFMRRHYYGDTTGFQRVARVVEQERS